MLKALKNYLLNLFSKKMQERRDRKLKAELAKKQVVSSKVEWELAHLEELTIKRLKELANNFPEARSALGVRMAKFNTVEKQEEIRKKKMEFERLKPQGKNGGKGTLMTMCENARKNMFG